MHLMKFKKQLKKGETYRFALVGSTLSSVQNNDPHNEAERLTLFAKLEGIERLYRAHQKAWNKLWESDIEVEEIYAHNGRSALHSIICILLHERVLLTPSLWASLA